MSFSIHGVGVSKGIAIGHAHLVSHALLEVVHYQVPKHLVEQEIARFDQAIQTVKTDLETVKGQLPSRSPAELSSFINTHVMILNDHTLSEDPSKLFVKNNQMLNGQSSNN